MLDYLTKYCKKFNKYKLIAQNELSAKRFTHSLNVAIMAAHLAKIHGAHIEKAAIAGILHDITKEKTLLWHHNFIAKNGYNIKQVKLKKEGLLHSFTGMIYAYKILKITDLDILNGIRYHTTGRANMSLIEKIVFVSDDISAERRYPGVGYIRKKAEKDLTSAFYLGYYWVIIKNLRAVKAISPDSLEGYNELILNETDNLKKFTETLVQYHTFISKRIVPRNLLNISK